MPHMHGEGFAPVDGAELYYRERGRGHPLVAVHGGPDMDHRYLLPDLDRLAEACRLICYDQRGRGRSRGEVRLETLGIERYVADLEGLRQHLRLDRLAILGHSWGGMVAMHYALAHPERVSHLVLLNTIPATHDDLQLMRKERRARWVAHQAELDALEAAFDRGEPAAVEAVYRIDFGTTFRRREDLARLDLRYTREDILTGRAIEARLMQGLVWSPGYSLLGELRQLRVPALVIHGALDFIPEACSRRIASAIPQARLVTLPESGHFSYIDAADALLREIRGFLAPERASTPESAGR